MVYIAPICTNRLLFLDAEHAQDLLVPEGEPFDEERAIICQSRQEQERYLHLLCPDPTPWHGEATMSTKVPKIWTREEALEKLSDYMVVMKWEEPSIYEQQFAHAIRDELDPMTLDVLDKTTLDYFKTWLSTLESRNEPIFQYIRGQELREELEERTGENISTF